ncbi:2-nitropropane dioxygenase, partial [Streptomyces tateyamensis]
GPAEAAALRAVGTAQVATVTSVAEARAAAALGMDALCVQGPEAGGHRGTYQVAAQPGREALTALLAAVGAAGPQPLRPAGGLRRRPANPPPPGPGAAAGPLGAAVPAGGAGGRLRGRPPR